MAENSTLSPRQRWYLAALITRGGVAGACRATGVGRRTAFTWLTQPDFRAVLREQQNALVREATAGALHRMGIGLDVLTVIAQDIQQPPAARVAAASKLIDTAMNLYELSDLTERIEQLEMALLGGKQ